MSKAKSDDMLTNVQPAVEQASRVSSEESVRDKSKNSSKSTSLESIQEGRTMETSTRIPAQRPSISGNFSSLMAQTPHRPVADSGNTAVASDGERSAFDAKATPARMTQMVHQKELDDLKAKLKSLENQRQEDRERLKELELLKSEFDSVVAAKDKVTGKFQVMQAEMSDLKKSLKDAISAKEEAEQALSENLDNLELVTLDKEMAEERVEVLQQELDLMKDKVEELSLDIEVYKQDRTGAGAESGPVETVQLEKQNERLREALVKLRDVTSTQEAELKQKIKQLELDNQSLQSFQGTHLLINEI